MRDDLPTFDLPMTANSGRDCGGHPLRSALLLTYVAFFILANSDGGSLSCCVCIAAAACGCCCFCEALEAGLLLPAWQQIKFWGDLHLLLLLLQQETGLRERQCLPEVEAS